MAKRRWLRNEEEATDNSGLGNRGSRTFVCGIRELPRALRSWPDLELDYGGNLASNPRRIPRDSALGLGYVDRYSADTCLHYVNGSCGGELQTRSIRAGWIQGVRERSRLRTLLVEQSHFHQYWLQRRVSGHERHHARLRFQLTTVQVHSRSARILIFTITSFQSRSSPERLFLDRPYIGLYTVDNSDRVSVQGTFTSCNI
jgi:hypothetical protein